jgi:hypothetical protein
MPYESFVMIKCDHGDVVQRVKDRCQKSEVRCQSAVSGIGGRWCRACTNDLK